jgi:hypothetical protein
MPEVKRLYSRWDKLYTPVIEKWIEQTKKGIYSNNNTIIDRIYLELIFNNYGKFFEGEDLDSWFKRFSLKNYKGKPINVEHNAKSGTSRLKLIAILASIQVTTGNAFNFESYVLTHFGIPSFETVKSRSKDKNEYVVTFKNCQTIMKK